MAPYPEITAVSVCSGVGGLDLGLELAIGAAFKPVLYVERDAYAAQVLARRMEETCLAAAPVWSDIKTLCGPKVRAYLGAALGGRQLGILFGGIPCQPFSVAGRQRGKHDERHLWPYFLAAVETYRPAAVFVENVPGLVGLGLREIGDELAALGYSVACGLFTAAEVGAPHKRERVFILAFTKGIGGEVNEVFRRCQSAGSSFTDGRNGDVADTTNQRGKQPRPTSEPTRHDATATFIGARKILADASRGGLGIVRQPPRRDGQPDGGGGDVGDSEHGTSGDGGTGQEGSAESGERRRLHRPADASGILGDTERNGRRECQPGRGSGERAAAGGAGATVVDTSGAGLPQRTGERRYDGAEREAIERASGALFPPGPGDFDGWHRVVADGSFDFRAPAVKPGVRVLADGLELVVDTSRADQLRCAGNGVVAVQCAAAFIQLLATLGGGQPR